MCLQGGPKPLGRAFAEPEFKTVDHFYRKPRLQFYDIYMGQARAGELLATFELIELDYSSFGEVTPISQSINQSNSVFLITWSYFSHAVHYF